MRGTVAMIALGLGLMACAPAPEVEGQKLYVEFCQSCHGVGGIGPDLARIAERNGGVFDDAAVLSQIDGFTRAVHGDLRMPEFGVMMEDQAMVLLDTGDGILTPVPRPMADILSYLKEIQV